MEAIPNQAPPNQAPPNQALPNQALPNQAPPIRDPCETISRRPHHRLRGHVLSLSGFRTNAPIAHRILPCNIPVLIIDITGAARVATGASAIPTIERDAFWGHGMTVGLTPAGVSALLGMPMRELIGQTVPMPAFTAELAERLAVIPDWPARFALLEEWLENQLPPCSRPCVQKPCAQKRCVQKPCAKSPDTEDPLITEAWFRLQRPNAPRVASVAASLGISRRRLETGFQRQIGLPPGTVARIARFQRAVSMIALGAALPQAAFDSGYADQPHFTRDVHTMSGLTPSALRANLQDALGRGS
ncbi:helix-turn-helix domain-containing protein [Actinoplanes sp. NPDC051861]|uniref:AraC family transcriptional regulator n=1 Tax=Actinoplanes sp. NPDC051861 TaxID=3155170 RepID=UPI003428C719